MSADPQTETHPIAAAPAARVAATLQGSLDTLSVRDVLALLAGSRRTGRLVVRPAQPLWLVLHDGRIVHAGASSTMVRPRHLLSIGALTAGDLEQMFSLSNASVSASLSPAEVLAMLQRVAEDGTLDPEALSTAIFELSVSTVTDLLSVPERDHRGELNTLVFTENDGVAFAPDRTVDLDDVVKAADSDLASLAEVESRIGDLESRVRRVQRLHHGTGSVTLDALDWAALAEIDGRATLAQLGHRLGLGRGRLYRLVESLLERGLVEPA